MPGMRGHGMEHLSAEVTGLNWKAEGRRGSRNPVSKSYDIEISQVLTGTRKKFRGKMFSLGWTFEIKA